MRKFWTESICSLDVGRLLTRRRRSELILASLLLSAASPFLCRAQGFFPLANVRPGMHGIGKTVFTGERIEEFQVEILGILPNLTPKGPIVLARLSGGPLAEAGIMQGMSGSPVYINGKLLGAVALGFPFSKEPIAGIQPIEAMIADSSLGSQAGIPASSTDSQHFGQWTFAHPMRPAELTETVGGSPVSSPFGDLDPLLTPLSLSGFTPATLQTFSAGFRHLGFQAQQGLSGSAAANQPADPTAIVPGSMISVGLLTGDMNIAADGTVTYVNGNRLYAFGHRFLDIGSVELPFAHSEVITVVPNLNSSFKLSIPHAWAGTILSDRSAAISGEIGRSPHVIPLSMTVHSRATGTHQYRFQVVNDRFLTPFITQTALFSVLDATERTLGAGTIQLTGHADWTEKLSPLVIHDTFISDSGLIQQVSADAVVPLGFVLGGGFKDLHLKELSFDIDATETKHQFHLAQAWTSAREVRPGDSLRVYMLLQGENGVEQTRSIDYQLPSGAPVGSLNFTVCDANTLNYPDFGGLSQSSAQSPETLIRTINSFRDGDSLYVRVWRQEPSFTISNPTSSSELTDPPPSVALVLSDPSNSANANAGLTLTRGSQVAELRMPTPGYVVTGAKTLQVEVKE